MTLTLTRKEIEPSGRAYEAVRKLARHAAKHDGWMQPELDDLGGDHGDIGSEHRSSWEQTCHWEHFYGNEISRIVDQQERRFSRDEPLEFEQRDYGLYEPLVDAFWEEWEERAGFWAAVEAAETSKAGA